MKGALSYQAEIASKFWSKGLYSRKLFFLIVNEMENRLYYLKSIVLGLNGKSKGGDSNVENMTKKFGTNWFLDSSEILDVSMRREGFQRDLALLTNSSVVGHLLECIDKAQNNFSMPLCQSRIMGFMHIFW